MHVAGIAVVLAAGRAGDVPEATAGFAVPRHARRQRIVDRNVDRTLQTEIVVIAGLGLDVAVVSTADDGIVRIHEDGAADRVLALERALRSAQHLDALDIVVGLFRDVAGNGRHAVAVRDHAGRRLRVVLALADPADVEIDALTEIVDRDVRCNELQLVDDIHAFVLKRIAAQNGGGNGGLLKVRRPALGGHHNGFNAAAFGRTRI